MDTVFIAGPNENLVNSAVRYNTVNGSANWVAGESGVRQIVATAGTLTTLRVRLSVAPGVGEGKSYAFTLMVNGSPTALTVTIAGTDTTGSDTSNTVAIAAEDKISMRCTPSGTPTVSRVSYSTIFTGDVSGESPMPGGYGSGSKTQREYVDWSGGGGAPGTNHDGKQVMPTSGTIKKLYIELDTGPGSGAEGFEYYLEVEGVETSLKVTITGADTSGSDLSNTVTVSAGDIIRLAINPVSSPSNNPAAKWGSVFVPDTDGEAVLMGHQTLPNASVDTYGHLHSSAYVASTTESDMYQVLPECYIKNLHAWSYVAPGEGNSWTVTLRKDGASTDLTVTWEDLDNDASDLENSSDFEAGDTATILIDPDGPDAAAYMTWGIVVIVGLRDDVYVKMASLDITDKIFGVRTERGKDRELGHAGSGIALITADNFNGDFSPENSGGEYYGTLDLGVLIEFYEVYGGTRYDHFTGKIDKITPHAELDNLIASIVALDGSDDLNIVEIETQLRTNTDSNTLVGDILDAAAWPGGDRDLDAGIDTFALAWFHQVLALAALQDLELQEKSFFYIDVDGDAQWEDRHHRLSGAHIVSQADFEDTAIELPYEWSKRNIGNYARLTGKRYTADAANSYLWGIFTGAAGAPFIPAGESITLWAVFSLALSSYDTPLTAGTHWNANTAYDKTGTDVTSDVSVVETQYGQVIKMVWSNAGTVGAYLVVPGSPPTGAPSNRTAIIMGKLYQEDEITHIEEDSTSQTSYGKRGIEIVATYKSNPNDLRAYAEWLIARFKDPVPSAIEVTHKAMTAWPDDTIKIQCLSRKISDRITVKSTKLGVDQDYYINKVIQDYQLRSGKFEHRCTWIVERAIGTAEGLFWVLGETGFSELGETTILGF